MSNEIIIEDVKKYTFKEAISIINEKYLAFFTNIVEKFKYHENLSGSLNSDLKIVKENVEKNNMYIIDFITDNFLHCLEQLSDHNLDYFIYQKDKITKKNGKFYKNKLPKIGSKTTLKKILEDNKESDKIFYDIIEMIRYLTFLDDDNNLVFNEEFVFYVKDNFCENRNFGKIIMVIDNIDNILESNLVNDNQNTENNQDNEDQPKNKTDKSNKSKKKSKKNTSDGGQMGEEFLKGLENTKIAQLAKNISEKINVNDFPSLNDPSKLLSSITNPDEEGGIQNLLKFVMDEVQGAFKNNNMNETELIDEAKDIMGNFQNMSGFDPMSILQNGNFDIGNFANMFANMGNNK
jgi:hypothetical protein